MIGMIFSTYRPSGTGRGRTGTQDNVLTSGRVPVPPPDPNTTGTQDTVLCSGPPPPRRNTGHCPVFRVRPGNVPELLLHNAEYKARVKLAP